MNLGDKKRNRKNNLNYKLQEKTSNNLIGIGCPARVVQTAADCYRLIVS
jgi:hypothetical protein